MGKIPITAYAHAAEPPARYLVPSRPSMSDALFTATQQRVLALLFGQPERSFFTKELIDLAASGSGSVQRELARLHQSGLLTQTIIGNKKHYRANADSPVFQELRGIVQKTLGPATVVRDALQPIASELALALVYGSVAAHTDAATSDIDLLLVSDTLTLEQVYAVLEPAELQLGRPISPTLYSLADFQRRQAQRNPFITKLLAGPTIRLIGSTDAITTG